MRGGVAASGSCGFLLFYVSFSELNVVFSQESRKAADIESYKCGCDYIHKSL